MRKVLRLKDIGIFKGGLTYSPENICEKEEGILVLRSSNIQNGKMSYLDNVYVNCEISNDLLIKKGDLLICSRNGSANLVGKTAQIEDDIYATWGAFMMIFRTSYNSRYAYYLLNDSITKNKGLFSTSTINQLTNSMLGNIYIHFELDIAEQEKIARYLDEKVGEIDQKVSLIEKKIERYQLLKKSIINKVVTKGLHPEAPLKDSHISWLGQIPEHWEVKRMKELVSFYNGYAFKSETYDNEGTYTIVTIANVQSYGFDTTESKKITELPEDLQKEQILSIGDLLISMTGNVGRVCFVNQANCVLNQRVGKLVCSPKIYNKYLYYALSNPSFIEYLKMNSEGSAQQNASKYDICNFSIPLPPYDEQCAIVEYLDLLCAQIEQKCSIINQQIEKYKTLKRALINEVVTGQRTIE